MVAILEPDDDEKYLLALLEDFSGLDIAEFCWVDQEREDGCWRAWDFQWSWYRETHPLQIDQCFPEGSLVLTSEGHKPIEQVEPGDLVLTHQLNWKPVVGRFDRGEQDLVSVGGYGHPGLRLTPDHELYVRHRRRRKEQLPPEWLPPTAWRFEHESHHQWASPASFPALGLPSIMDVYAPGRSNDLAHWMLDDGDFWWLCGLYLAEGSTSSSFGKGGKRNRVTFSLHEDEAVVVEALLEGLGFAFSVEKMRGRCVNVKVNSLTLASWLTEMFGSGAGSKFIHPSALGVDEKLREEMLNGALFGDGYHRDGTDTYSTVSRSLAFDMRLLSLSLGFQASVNLARKAGEHIIEGRVVKTRDKYTVNICKYKPSRPRIDFDGGLAWSRVAVPVGAGRARCYDLSVEDDNSFVVEGVIAHNCGRAVGKTNGIEMRAFAFPFNYPGQEMLITAPELNHLRPIVDKVEARLLSRRFSREMLPITGKSMGISRQPQWQVRFTNGARILSRLPNRDGRGVKGSISPDSLVLTRGGHVRADQLRVGDEVLTHRNRWRPIESISRGTEVDMVSIDGGGYRGLSVSWNHRMFGRRNANPQRKRNLGQATAVVVDDPELTDRWYFGSPTLFPATEPEFPGWSRDDEALLQLAGWYVAKGNQGECRVVLTVHGSKVSTVTGLADRLGLGSRSRHKHGKAYSVHIYGVGLAQWLLEHFGQHAAGKRVPAWLLGADPLMQASFLDAYLEGDGHRDDRKMRTTVSTASRELALGVRMLGQALGRACSMSFVDPKPNAYCASPRRTWRVTLSDHEQTVISEAGWAWQKVRSVVSLDERSDVITLAVSEDHSFVADGLLHHNIHATCIELDEGQDYPAPGWTEIVESRNSWAENSFFRVHGVSNGVRDKYYDMTQPGSGYRVHRWMGMHRPTWSKQEREQRIRQYGRSRQSPDYRRNVYGEHGDATNPLFVLARLTACIDLDEGSDYNTSVYQFITITSEQVRSSENPAGPDIIQLVDPPGTHLSGWSQIKKGYTAFYGGMDVGLTRAPSEIVIFGQRPDRQIDLLLRVQLRRIKSEDQKALVRHLFGFYGAKLRSFGIDAGGLGFPIFQDLQGDRLIGSRIHGWKFDEKVVVGFEDRELERNETMDDLAIVRPFVEHSTDLLRNEYVDAKRILLPNDGELINEFQGQTYVIKKSAGNPYGKRSYSEGSFHALDAVRLAIGAKEIPPLEKRRDSRPEVAPILEQFVGM